MMLLFFDVETCGFVNSKLSYDHPAQPPLVQLGAILVDADNGAEWATLELIVRPDGYEIPTAASAVHGITTKLASHKPSHPGPDVECAIELVTPMCKMPPTERMIAAGRGDQFKNPKLVEAHQFLFGEGFDGAHSALADARATKRVWFEAKRRIVEEAKENAS